MEFNVANLPDDPAALKKMCMQLGGELTWLKNDVARLEAMLRLLRHQKFGAKSEQISHPSMRALFPEQGEQEDVGADKAAVPVKGHTRTAKPRQPFPDSLPRIDRLVDVPEADKSCSCCGGRDCLKVVSEEISEKLNIQPAVLSVIRYRRPVYSCKDCETMRVAPMPPHPIPKCSVTTESLAHIAIAKYLDALPLYRQDQIYARSGVEIGRDKMARWMVDIGAKLAPVRDLLHRELLSGPLLNMDETTHQVLKESGRLPTAKGYMVVQARGGPPGQAIVLFHYSQSRSSDAMAKLLEGFKGTLLTDGLEVYRSFCRLHPELIHAGCWAHGRRKFAEAQKGSAASSRKGSLAAHGLASIDALFAIEREGEAMNADQRRQLRQEKAAPIMAALKEWIEAKVESVPKKSLVGVAMRYLLGQWSKLVICLDDGRIPIHNNFVENMIRPYAVGRRNWLFSDRPEGAESSAILYSLLVTAKVNGLDPLTYLTSALKGIAAGAALETLLPIQ